MHGLLCHIEAEIIGRTMNVTGLHASPGHPDAERTRVMVAPVGLLTPANLSHRSPPEFTRPHDKRLLEQASLF